MGQVRQEYSDPRRADDPHALPDLEVFFADDVKDAETGEFRPAGFYWWPCFPGCLPDGEAAGPFDTEAEALADARQGLDDDGSEP
jgi:hypothetical protein